MRVYPLIPNFDGRKFANRYGLNTFHGDFWAADGNLFIVPDLPDDPPIFETPDPFVPAPNGIHVHTMRKAEGKISNKFISSEIDSNCVHVVMDFESQLTDPWLLSIPMDAGSAAYCRDTEKQWFWNGTAWKKP